jgi:hypothetical protein
MAAIFCMFFAAYPPMMATLLLWLRKMCIWLHKGYVGHRKIWWGYGYATPPCLHWYTTVVTQWRQNSSKFCCAPPSWAVEEPSPIILPLLFFSSPAQVVLPLTDLLSPQDRGKFTLATLTPPL